MAIGDLIEVEVEGIGRLRNQVVEADEGIAPFGAMPRGTTEIRAEAMGTLAPRPGCRAVRQRSGPRRWARWHLAPTPQTPPQSRRHDALTPRTRQRLAHAPETTPDTPAPLPVVLSEPARTALTQVSTATLTASAPARDRAQELLASSSHVPDVLRRHLGRRAHGASSRDAHNGEDRVHAGTDHLPDRGDRDRDYQRFPEILRKLGASGLMALPTEAEGAAREDIETYLPAATLTGPERLRLLHLVWDACSSAFASRQALYEYYFFGDPLRMAGALVNGYDTAPYAERVRGLLREPVVI